MTSGTETTRYGTVQARAFGDLAGQPTAIAVYAALATWANRDGECWPHRQTIADQLGLSVATVRRALRVLRAAGSITTRPRMQGNAKIGTVYLLVPTGRVNSDLSGRVKGEPSPRARDPLLEKEQLGMNKENAEEPILATVIDMPSDRIVDVPSVVDLVFAEWVRVNNKTGVTKLLDQRRKVIEARFTKDGYPLEDILDAVRGCAASDWDVEHGHTDLTYSLRDGVHLEKFRDKWRNPARARGSVGTSSGYDKFAEIERRFPRSEQGR